jgi:MFS family permease
VSAIVGADSQHARPPIFWLLLPFAAGYGVSYFFRTVNAVAGPMLAAEFNLGPDRLGFLTSAYFLAFSLAQIPVGIALDRFGPARVNIVMVLSGALGALIFGCSDSAWGLALGRALIGLGAGAALMSSMSAVHLWAGRDRAATTIGFIMTLGGLGAVVASTPTQWVIDRVGWRMVFLMLSALCCLIAIAMLGTLKASRPAAAGCSGASASRTC